MEIEIKIKTMIHLIWCMVVCGIFVIRYVWIVGWI